VTKNLDTSTRFPCAKECMSIRCRIISKWKWCWFSKSSCYTSTNTRFPAFIWRKIAYKYSLHWTREKIVWFMIVSLNSKMILNTMWWTCWFKCKQYLEEMTR